MPAKGIKETEKVSVGAIRTAIQTWLAPQLTTISERLTHVEARLDGIDHRLDGIDKRIDGLESRMEVRFETVNKRFDAVDKRIDAVHKRTTGLEQQMSEFFRSTRSEFEGRIDAVRSDIRRLDNVAELRERLASLEAKLGQHN